MHCNKFLPIKLNFYQPYRFDKIQCFFSIPHVTILKEARPIVGCCFREGRGSSPYVELITGRGWRLRVSSNQKPVCQVMLGGIITTDNTNVPVAANPDFNNHEIFEDARTMVRTIINFGACA